MQKSCLYPSSSDLKEFIYFHKLLTYPKNNFLIYSPTESQAFITYTVSKWACLFLQFNSSEPGHLFDHLIGLDRSVLSGNWEKSGLNSIWSSTVLGVWVLVIPNFVINKLCRTTEIIMYFFKVANVVFFFQPWHFFSILIIGRYFFYNTKVN